MDFWCFFMEQSLWFVLLNFVNDKKPKTPPDWLNPSENFRDLSKRNAIFSIETMASLGQSDAKNHFNKLDANVKQEIWYILALARQEGDKLNRRYLYFESGGSSWLDTRTHQERLDTASFVQQKIKRLKPLLNLYDIIQPASLYERFLKTTTELMAGLSTQDREILDLALSDCVRSMTGR